MFSTYCLAPLAGENPFEVADALEVRVVEDTELELVSRLVILLATCI